MILCQQKLHAQDHINIKFGEITSADFTQGAPKFDSGANAVIISDVGKTSFEGNNNGRFTLVFTRFLRVKILNKNGLGIASRIIAIYHDLDRGTEKITSLAGITYNLENGTVIKTRLDEKLVYTEKYNKNYDNIKFSLPGVKEGAIFDLQYTVKSPFETQLRPWEFQGEYPRLWSEYEVIIPPCYHYVMSPGGNQDFDISTTKEKFETFTIRENVSSDHTDEYSLSGKSVQERWVKKNVPSLHEEPFTTTLDNYYSRISFQLNYFQWDNYNDRQDYMVN